MGLKIETKKGRPDYHLIVARAGRDKATTPYVGTLEGAEHYRDDIQRQAREDRMGLVEYVRRIGEKRRERQLVAKIASAEKGTLREEMEQYFQDQEQAGDLRYSSHRTYTLVLGKWVYPTLGDVRADRITPAQLGETIKKMKAAGLSYSMLAHLRNALSGLYKHLVREKIVETNPTLTLHEYIGKEVRRKARVRQKIKAAEKWFTKEQAERILAAARALYPGLETFIMVLFQTGARWGEVSALRWTDIGKTSIHIQRTFAERGGAVNPTKDSEDRHVPISPALRAALAAHKEQMALEASAGEWDAEARQWMFRNSRGHVMHYPQFWACWKRLCKAAGVEYHSEHAARHSFASWILQRSQTMVTVEKLRQWLGHATIEQTMGTYAHLLKDEEGDQVVVAALDLTAK